MGHALRAILWQGLSRLGAEWCELAQENDGWRLSGTALVAVGDEPFAARYDIALAADWSTRQAHIALRTGAEPHERTLRLLADHAHGWRIERDPPAPPLPGDDAAAVHALIDIDLGFTPATNTLPIRRLAPAVGAAVDVTALWVRFPELTIEPLPQRYTRTSQHRYRYESAGGAFVADLEVDDLGLVVTYEGGWQRIAASPAPTETPR
jgi:hypothetical protein